MVLKISTDYRSEGTLDLKLKALYGTQTVDEYISRNFVVLPAKSETVSSALNLVITVIFVSLVL